MMIESNKVSVLVTAVGSELAMSVIKALKIATLDIVLFGTDIFTDAVGKHWCDQFYIISKATDKENYKIDIEHIVKTQNIDIIIPTSDYEYELFDKAFLALLKPAQVLLQPKQTRDLLNDKWEAFKEFEKYKIGTPSTWLPEEFEISKTKFPIIIKPRQGGGSRHIYRCNSNEELEASLPLVPLPIIQECILPDDSEHTAGVFRSSNDDSFSIILKRSLKFGMTNKAVVVKNELFDEFCINTLKRLNIFGSVNIQFRVRNGEPKILEINPRFSGTTGIRAHFGFNDTEMWIRDSLKLEQIKPHIRPGSVSRYMEEKYEF